MNFVLSALVVSAVSATTTTVGPGTVGPAAIPTTVVNATTKPPSTATTAATTATNASTTAVASPLDNLKPKSYPGDAYHMPFVRVVQARVQSDKPELVKGRFVSKFGNGDLAKGYVSGLDSVNTASVEGALMYVQAEGINQNARSAEDRCVRKNKMSYIVLYEILIAQTNETIAQFEKTWNVPEYGPMIPMDNGRCTPLSGEDVFPAECLQFNGAKNQPNLGPFVGAGLKNDDVRAPYPNTFWFSFPHTCPLSVWNEKSDACRASSRKGLCDLGKAPDGVECTFAYDILGWVPIDDVVGITSIQDKATGKPFGNFTLWCEASAQHVEFAGDDKTGKMTAGLPFWEDPLNATRNQERASKVVELYQDMLAATFRSSQVSASDLKYFKDLPNPLALAAQNPPCYKTVPKCNTGFGCKRSGFSQLCVECTATSAECKTDANFKFPALAKAPTSLKDEELTSGTKLGGKNGATGALGKAGNATPTAAPKSLALSPVVPNVVVAVLAVATAATLVAL